MIEERRFFLRTALFATAVAIVYWFLSYEAAGSVMLLAIGLTAGFLMLVMRHHTGEARRGPLGVLHDAATFENPDEGAAGPLAIQEGPLPAMSLPPLIVATGAGAITGGMVFGAWLWLPGAVVVALGAWRWLTELMDPQAT